MHGSNSDCPADCPCITLNQLAVNELITNRRNTDNITLILLDGLHTSTVLLSFAQINHVIVTSQDTVNLWAATETPQTLIQLLSSKLNILVVDVSTLEIKNLAIDASGRGVLLVQKHSDSWSISFDQIVMFGIIVQIQPLSDDATAVVTITSSLFKIGRIEIKLCVYGELEANRMKNAIMQQSMPHIKSTKFLTRKEIQLNSVVIFSWDDNYYFDSKQLLFDMEDVTILALADGVPMPSFPLPYFCDDTTELARLSDIYIFSRYVKMHDCHKQ